VPDPLVVIQTTHAEKIMFQRVSEYGLMRRGGRWFRPRAYAEDRPDSIWEGWLIFFPLDGDAAIATDRETTQPTLAALSNWAMGVSPVYLEGALDRALKLAAESPVIAKLTSAEYDRLADAEEFDTAAAIECAAADVDEAAAEIARADAVRIRRERLVTEAAVAAEAQAAANLEADVYEHAAEIARSEAAAAGKRDTAARTAAERNRSRRSDKQKKK
jgi:hypothetical protein